MFTRNTSLPFVAMLSLLLASCGASEAPLGRWEGVSESTNWLVAVRLQVDPGNVIHSTALSINVSDTALPERAMLSDKIRSMLPDEWERATSSKVDFVNNVIRRAGGFAPMFVYDPGKGTMTFNFYGGGKHAEHVKLHPVKNFMVTD